MLTINLDSANIICTTTQLTKANADNETIHIAFRNGWLKEVMGRVKINFFDVLDENEQ